MNVRENPDRQKKQKKPLNSDLRYVEIDFRSMMGEKRLNALLLVCVRRDMFLGHGKIIEIYAFKYTRRMLLFNPLSEN